MVLESIRGIDILIHKLKSKQPELRYESLLCLAKYPYSQYIQNVIPLLDDFDKRIRLLTMKLISKHKIHNALPVLKSRIAKEKESDLECYLFYTLSVFKDQSIIQKLIDLVHSGDKASIYWGIKGLSNYGEKHLKSLIEFLGSDKWYAKSRANWELVRMNEVAKPSMIKAFDEIISKYDLRKKENEEKLITDFEIDIIFWLIRISRKIKMTISGKFRDFIITLNNADIINEYLDYCNNLNEECTGIFPYVYPMLKSDNLNIREVAMDYFKNVGLESFIYLYPMLENEPERSTKLLCSEIFGEVFSVHEDVFVTELHQAEGENLYWLLNSYDFFRSQNLCSKVASVYWKYKNDKVIINTFVKIIRNTVSEDFQDIAIDILKNHKIDFSDVSDIAYSYCNWIMNDIIKLYGHPSWRMRKEIFKAIIKIGQGAVNGLIKHLDDSDENIRYWVLKSIEEIGEIAVKSVLKNFEEIKSCDVRGQLIELTGKFKIEEYKQVIIDGIYDEDWVVRAKSCSAIGIMKIRGFEAKLMEYTLEEDENLRGNAALALGLLQHREGIYSITKLLDDVYYEVRQKVVMGLGYFGDHSVLPLLFSKLTNEEIGVKQSIVKAVGLFDDSEILLKLVPFLKDKMIRISIVELFGQKRLLKSVKFFKEFRNSSDTKLRRAVIEALYKMSSNHAKKLLTSFLNDSSWELRKMTRDFLIDIDFHASKKLLDDKITSSSNRIKLGMLLLKKNHIAQAIFTFQKLLESDSRSIPALIGLAFAYRKKKTYSKAEIYFKKAALYSNDTITSNKIELYLVTTLIDNGKVDDARIILDRLSTSDDTKFVAIVENILKSIRK